LHEALLGGRSRVIARLVEMTGIAALAVLPGWRQLRPAGAAYATLRWTLVMDSFDLCAAVEEAANEADEADEEVDDDEW
jgi:hypothetical protein